VRRMLDAGADAAQTATAAAHNPTLPASLEEPASNDLSEIALQLLRVVERRPGSDAIRIASAAGMPITRVRFGLLELERRGLVARVDSGKGRPQYLVDDKALERQLTV
jgi:hypothetical protein